jgi:small-conductance mechanosensitive channel
MLDSTMVIIPNSDFITKPVQNRTISRPAARIELGVYLANPAEVRRAIEIILGVARAEDAVVDSPAPTVVVDSQSETGVVKLACALYVQESRDGSKIRSQLYVTIFEAFAAQRVALAGQAVT